MSGDFTATSQSGSPARPSIESEAAAAARGRGDSAASALDFKGQRSASSTLAEDDRSRSASNDTNGQQGDRQQAGGLHFVQGIELAQMRSVDAGRSPLSPKEMIVDVLPSSLPYDTPHLHRVLSWWSLTSMGVGATIGAGIFVMTGIVAREVTGPAISLSFVVAAVACLFTGLCYAEFAAMAPSAGSAYAYARATMGQFLGFMLGWDLILEYAVAAAAVAASWSHYLDELLGFFGTRMPVAISTTPFSYESATGHVSATGAFLNLPALLISLVLMVLLVCGVRDSARFNNVMVAIKVGVVLFVIILGSTLVNTDNWFPFAPMGYGGFSFFGKPLPGQQHNEKGGAVGVLAGAALVFFSYIGFDSVGCHAEEARKPERDVPIALLLSLALSTALYVAVCIVLTGMVHYTQIDIAAPLSAAFGHRGYHWAQYLIAVGAVVGITSVLLVTMLSQPRILMAMSRDGLLPPFFRAVHPRFQTPWKGTIITGIVVGLLGSLVPVTVLVEFVSIGTLMAFTFVCASVLILRHTQPDRPRPFRCPLVPLVPILGMIFCIALMFSLPATNWYRLLVWFGIGCIVYLCYGRRHGIGDEHRLASAAAMSPRLTPDARSRPMDPGTLRVTGASPRTLGTVVLTPAAAGNRNGGKANMELENADADSSITSRPAALTVGSQDIAFTSAPSTRQSTPRGMYVVDLEDASHPVGGIDRIHAPSLDAHYLGGPLSPIHERASMERASMDSMHVPHPAYSHAPAPLPDHARFQWPTTSSTDTVVYNYPIDDDDRDLGDDAADGAIVPRRDSLPAATTVTSTADAEANEEERRHSLMQ